MLKKQSIRSNQTIFINNNDKSASKDEILALSEFWNDKEEGLFRKLLKQGGSTKIQGTHFKVVVQEKQLKLRDMQ
tara:strand:+ start:852 stop:1076 length:225 start_codon:yes stop_codon:yes gene_type:complete